MIGDDRTTSELTRLLGSLPPAVQALTGTDISKVSWLSILQPTSWKVYLVTFLAHSRHASTMGTNLLIH